MSEENTPLKILNLYAGIGGNRKLWDEVTDIEVTAVEIKEEIANIYQDFFPEDEVVIADAHEYLKEHYEEFDFIWSSPPCPTHSRLRKNFAMNDDRRPIDAKYPDMELYEEILFLKGYFKGNWVVENVISWYEPLIRPQEVARHYFWSNFIIPTKNLGRNLIQGYTIDKLQESYGFDLSDYTLKNSRKDQVLKNCVHPKLGKHILECAVKKKQKNLHDMVK